MKPGLEIGIGVGALLAAGAITYFTIQQRTSPAAVQPLVAIPNSSDGPDTWLNWYSSMQSSAIGTSMANEKFKLAWSIEKPTAANTSELREAMKAHGVIIDATNPFGTLEDGTKDLLDGAFTVAKVITYAAFAIIGGGLIIAGVGFFKGSLKVTAPVPVG